MTHSDPTGCPPRRATSLFTYALAEGSGHQRVMDPTAGDGTAVTNPARNLTIVSRGAAIALVERHLCRLGST